MKNLSKANCKVSDVQNYLSDLYGRVNTNMSQERIWGFTAEKAGNLSRVTTRVFRKQITPEDTEAYFVSMFSWLLALANKFGRNVEVAFISKFPGVCPYCLEAPCICLETGRRPRPPQSVPEIKQELEAKARIYLGYDTRKPITFGLATHIVKTVYPQNRYEFSRAPEQHFAKILEELAELRIAIRRFEEGVEKVAAIDDELADVFAWSCSAWSLIHGTSAQGEESLFNGFMKHYETGCPRCRTAPCLCKPGVDQLTSTVGSRDVEAVMKAIEPLVQSLHGEAAANLQLIVQNLAAALGEPKGFMVKNALRSADESLTKIAASPLDETERVHIGIARAYLKNLIVY